MGSLRPSRSDAEIWQGSFSDYLVVGRPKSRKDGLDLYRSLEFAAQALNPHGPFLAATRPPGWATFLFINGLCRLNKVSLPSLGKKPCGGLALCSASCKLPCLLDWLKRRGIITRSQLAVRASLSLRHAPAVGKKRCKSGQWCHRFFNSCSQ
jgi:hypothetical protein